ncbi:MAG: hypothetical protein QOD74_1003 [Variibacter sp.]|jgi:hypothetical protein|nr:hypothetical protein [Variibacter sp.]
MRVLIIAAAIAALATPSFAQMMNSAGPDKPKASPEELKEKKRKSDSEEKAASKAVERLPNQKYDPWRTAR